MLLSKRTSSRRLSSFEELCSRGSADWFVSCLVGFKSFNLSLECLLIRHRARQHRPDRYIRMEMHVWNLLFYRFNQHGSSRYSIRNNRLLVEIRCQFLLVFHIPAVSLYTNKTYTTMIAQTRTNIEILSTVRDRVPILRMHITRIQMKLCKSFDFITWVHYILI